MVMLKAVYGLSDLTDVIISVPGIGRTYYVHEFVRPDGSLPDDLKGKGLDEPAYYEASKEASTMTGSVLAGRPKPKLGDTVAARGLVFVIIWISDRAFKASTPPG